MGLEPSTVSALFSAAPWAFVAALIVWPEKGVLALWIKRGQAIKLAELERGKTHEALKIEAEKRAKALPAPEKDQ